jgi:hypothetical protein
MIRIEPTECITNNQAKAKEITYRVQNKRESGDNRTFAEVLQEELDKAKRGDK